ncbi:hypothetical protein [Legionella shakespearei]|uniref:Putative esterase with patatin domain protein n=1 Tax=Legionella shakespearei DSM 23087 TaxID=1122169 RepID=A0A0W0Z7N0_9GAMM|nr:hypothetical protein [Legionella shakespearei]KTD65132.1 putative esterase with patatin domain protein [Legionella shakespearei DSM 23087]
MTHSKLYTDNVREFLTDGTTEQRLDVDAVTALTDGCQLSDLQHVYSQISDLLRETNDAQFGIESQLIEGQWVRNATRAVPLAERMSHEAPVIEANNALMRCLARLRPIDYAIGKKHHENNPALEAEVRDKLKAQFAETATLILHTAQSGKSDEQILEEIKKLEKKFNTALIQGLHDANLSAGCESVEDAEKLLFHYRNLSSLLDPARTMVTLTYDEEAKVLQRETQYPVTKKSERQKLECDALRMLQPHPFKEEKNGHNVRNLASQQADSLFADLMVQDDRALPAQARKTHLTGTKNAFIVKNELIPVESLPDEARLTDYQASTDNTLWLARTGVPVYVGSGEDKESIQLHTTENLQQIRRAAQERMGRAELYLHVTCLNTYTPLENQKSMIDHLYEATRGQESGGDEISYVPTNHDGTFRAMDVAPHLVFAEGSEPSYSLPLQKADRLAQVTKVVLAAAQDEATVSIVQCASGQDRTGTAVEKATQVWMQSRYAALGRNAANIETMRALGGNAAEIATHLVPGSPGMKKESMANNFFGDESAFSKTASEQFYLSSAETNKKNPVGAVDFLTKPSQAARAEYEANLQAFEKSLIAYKDSIGQDENKQKFYDNGQILLNNVKAVAADHPDSKALSDLNTVLVHAKVMLQPDRNSPEFQESTRRLASMSHEVSGRSSSAWKALGIGLLAFACVALVVAGVLAAIPSGGSSLLLTVAGATGLSLGAAAGLGAGIVGGAALSGAASVAIGSEKGLAKSIFNFKSALHEIKDSEEEHKSSNNPK